MRHRFQRVADGVPEVQNPAEAGLAFVGADDLRLDPGGLGDGGEQHRGVPGEERPGAGPEPVKERAARDHPVFDDLKQARPELAPRQRGEHGGVGHDYGRLVKGADQVLAERVVHARLAANGAVHLREERGRHMRQRDAAQERRRRKPSHVAYDTAADSHHRAPAIGAAANQPLVDVLRCADGLVAFAVWHEDHGHVAQGPLNGCAVQVPHLLVGDDEAARAHTRLVQPGGQLCQHALADKDGRDARARAHLDALWGRRGSCGHWDFGSMDTRVGGTNAA